MIKYSNLLITILLLTLVSLNIGFLTSVSLKPSLSVSHNSHIKLRNHLMVRRKSNKNNILLETKTSLSKVFYNNIGKSAKPIVSGTAATLVVISKETAPIYYIAGGIVNAFLSKFLNHFRCQ